jgi:hypothetical protein
MFGLFTAPGIRVRVPKSLLLCTLWCSRFADRGSVRTNHKGRHLEKYPWQMTHDAVIQAKAFMIMTKLRKPTGSIGESGKSVSAIVRLDMLIYFSLNVSSTTSFFHIIVKPLFAYIQTSYRFILALSWLHRQFQCCVSLIQPGTSCANQVMP